MKGEKFPLILFLEELVKNQYELFTVKYLDCYSTNDHHASDTHTRAHPSLHALRSFAPSRNILETGGGPRGDVAPKRRAHPLGGGVRAAVAAHEQVPGPPQGAMLG